MEVYWVTGASSGIGRELSLQLSERGHYVIMSSRNVEKLDEVARLCKHSERMRILPMDISNYHSITEKVEEAIAFFGRVDVLVNNAGISQRSLIMETKMKVYEQLMRVNYLGTVALSKALLPHFIKNKTGQFVVVSSLMGKFSSPFRSGYCGAKHALHGFFDALRMEHEKDGIHVTIVCPGFVRTDVAKNALKGDGSAQHDDDVATKNGLPVHQFCIKMLEAMAQKRFEVYIAGAEKKGIYVKRFFPRLLHRLVLKSQVR